MQAQRQAPKEHKKKVTTYGQRQRESDRHGYTEKEDEAPITTVGYKWTTVKQSDARTRTSSLNARSTECSRHHQSANTAKNFAMTIDGDNTVVGSRDAKAFRAAMDVCTGGAGSGVYGGIMNG